MSALFGIIRLNGSSVHPDELSRMAGALAVHGGDGGGTWIQKNAGLGHAVRVITPEDAFEQQPILIPESCERVLFCGRLDNRAALISDIGLGDAFELSDSAIVAAAFQRWGAECADQLQGDFVFVVWQSREGRVLMARGPLSNRSLFYFWDGTTLAFASSPLGLFALPFVPRDLDRDRLADYLIRAPIVPGRSFFRGIHTVPGGTITSIDANGVRTRTYWEPSRLPEIRYRSDDDYVEAFLERFDNAVRARLRSAFPIAVMMSGGIDSSAIACTAAAELARQDRRLLAFTQVPDEPSSELAGSFHTDERPFVQSIARMYPNIDLHLVPTRIESLVDGHAAFIAVGGAPFRNMGNRPWMEEILHLAQSQGARVVLTGEAGNSGFSWSGKGTLPGLLRSGQIGAAWRHAGALKSRSTLRTFIGKGLVPLLPAWMWVAVMRCVEPDNPLAGAKPRWSNSPLRTEYVKAQRLDERSMDDLSDILRRPERAPQQARPEMLRQLETYGSEAQCGLEARHGTEVRDATADRRLVEFCFSIPEVQFQLNGVSRSLPRRAMAGRWPKEVSDNRRRGLQASDWHRVLLASRSELRTALDHLSTSPLAVEILDLDRMRKVLEEFSETRRRSPQTYADVHYILYLGLALGQFFQWIESPRPTVRPEASP